MVVAGDAMRIARMVLAKCSAPPSAKSSLSTEVITTCCKPRRATASPTLSGSCGSSWSGLPVATLQKAQARVQIEPKIIIVACFCDQHSPILGQAASSQTVTKSSSRINFLVSVKAPACGAFTRSQSGRRGCGRSSLRRFSG